MNDVILKLVDVPLVRMFILAGIIFLMIAVLGKIEGKIEPGRLGRIGAAILGAVFILIGIAMQYGETHDIRTQLPPEVIASLPAQGIVAIPAPASSTANADTVPIKVVAATYGKNCNGKAGNATPLLSKSCDGRGSCDFVIDTATLEDPAPNCSKDFSAEWKCGSGNVVFSAALSSLSGKGDKLRLNCNN